MAQSAAHGRVRLCTPRSACETKHPPALARAAGFRSWICHQVMQQSLQSAATAGCTSRSREPRQSTAAHHTTVESCASCLRTRGLQALSWRRGFFGDLPAKRILAGAGDRRQDFFELPSPQSTLYSSLERRRR